MSCVPFGLTPSALPSFCVSYLVDANPRSCWPFTMCWVPVGWSILFVLHAGWMLSEPGTGKFVTWTEFWIVGFVPITHISRLAPAEFPEASVRLES